MNTSTSAPVAAKDVTDVTLKAVPARTLRFLQGAGAPGICTALASVGWSVAHSEAAWELLMALRGTVAVPSAPKVDPVLDAIAACEVWQATVLVRARARLTLSFPEQGAFLFEGSVPGKGMGAVLNVATFLTRRRTLAKGTGRKATRKLDHEALALLEETGVTKEEITRLGALVDSAHEVVVTPSAVTEQAKRIDAERLAVLRKLYAWLHAWSGIARTVITRRDQLIRLGLAKRRSAKTKSTPPVAPATPTLVATVQIAEEPAPESSPT